MSEIALSIRTSRPQQKPAFVYRHVVTFEETNFMGNVYFVRHVAWQGRCREMFLREHAPSILDDITRTLRLVTLSVSCAYYEELRAFDEIEVHMRLSQQQGHRLSLQFDYTKIRNGVAVHVARGLQEIACMLSDHGKLIPTPVPRALIEALQRYQP